MKRQLQAGFTLVELMVYSVLLGLLMTGVYTAFSISRAYFDSAQGTTEVQQECLKAMNGLSRLLGQGNASTVTTQAASPGPSAVRILSARTNNGVFQHDVSTGNVTWQRWAVAYYDTASREIRLKEATGTGLPSTQVPSPAPTIAALIADSSLSVRPLARNISSMTVNFTAATSNTAAFVTFFIESTVQTQRFGTNKIGISSRITLKQ